MSHDRGCSCGREKLEYEDCIEPNCFKKEFKMEDTDWRPSPCPSCGHLRAAEAFPICRNKKCREYLGRTSQDMLNKRSMKSENLYLWVKQDRAPMFVSNLVELYKDRDFNPDEDKIYEVGPEVKLELSVKITPAKPVTRWYDPANKE